MNLKRLNYINENNQKFPNGSKLNKDLLEESIVNFIKLLPNSRSMSKLVLYGGRRLFNVPVKITITCCIHKIVFVNIFMIKDRKEQLISRTKFNTCRSNERMFGERVKYFVDTLERINIVDFDKLRNSISEEINNIKSEYNKAFNVEELKEYFLDNGYSLFNSSVRNRILDKAISDERDLLLYN